MSTTSVVLTAGSVWLASSAWAAHRWAAAHRRPVPRPVWCPIHGDIVTAIHLQGHLESAHPDAFVDCPPCHRDIPTALYATHTRLAHSPRVHAIEDTPQWARRVR